MSERVEVMRDLLAAHTEDMNEKAGHIVTLDQENRRLAEDLELVSSRRDRLAEEVEKYRAKLAESKEQGDKLSEVNQRRHDVIQSLKIELQTTRAEAQKARNVLAANEITKHAPSDWNDGLYDCKCGWGEPDVDDDAARWQAYVAHVVKAVAE